MGVCLSKESSTKTTAEERWNSIPQDPQLQLTNEHVCEKDRAILDIKIQRDRLRQYQNKISSILVKERQLAKSLLESGEKEKALFVLKRKRYQENLMKSVSTNLSTVEQMVHTVEFQFVQNEVVECLRKGNEVLKRLQDEINVTELQEIIADSDALKEANEELQALMGQSEEGLTEELEQELLDIQLAQVPVILGKEKTNENEEIPVSKQEIQKKTQIMLE